MYTVLYIVKTNNHLSEGFKSKGVISKSGGKQECNPNPTLSNIYQNDMYKLFDDTCEPISNQ